MEEKRAVALRYFDLAECPLYPDFLRILAPDGEFLWNHYRRISRKKFVDWYQLSSDVIFQGVSDGKLEGLQVQLSSPEFRRIADRCYEGFQFWRIGEAA